ncbi:MAG: hypothetical protein V4640_01880 [Verrucomicrobiota bacterium]
MKTFAPSFFVVLFPFAVCAQGDLTPPAGVPAAGMKTLTQVEPRTPIPAGPAVPVAGPHFTITAPGSYYLTGNITVAEGNAINITATDGGVSLDLNGYTIRSTHASGSGSAIHIANTSNHTTIRNGHILGATTYNGTNFVLKGFSGGIVAATPSSGHQIHHVTVSGLAGPGISVNFSSNVSHCIVKEVSGNGISAGVVTDSAAEVIGGTGISGTTISNCNASSMNTDSLAGISGGTISNCTASSKGGPGITGAIIDGCTGSSNGSSSGLIDKSYGLFASTSVSNSRGSSNYAWGIYCSNGNVTNSYGFSNNSSLGGGIFSPANVSFSIGYCSGGTAISAFNAIGCSAVFGTVTATNKSLGTP